MHYFLDFSHLLVFLLLGIQNSAAGETLHIASGSDRLPCVHPCLLFLFTCCCSLILPVLCVVLVYYTAALIWAAVTVSDVKSECASR